MNENSPHLDFEAIVDKILGDSAVPAFESHLNDCSECSMEVNRAAQLIAVMRADDSEDVPSYAIASLLRAFDEYSRLEEVEVPRTAREIIEGLLRLDSFNLSPAFGLRSTSPASSRQLVYSVDGGTVDLRISSTKAGFSLIGQVLGLVGGLKIRLLSEGFESVTEIEADGMFRFQDIVSGTYSISIESELRIFQIREIDV